MKSKIKNLNNKSKKLRRKNVYKQGKIMKHLRQIIVGYP